MMRSMGVAFQTTANGKITKVTIDMKRWGHLMEDVLDAIAIEGEKLGKSTPWEEIKAKLDQKHRIKR